MIGYTMGTMIKSGYSVRGLRVHGESIGERWAKRQLSVDDVRKRERARLLELVGMRNS
jgi:hypothetical protein